MMLVADEYPRLRRGEMEALKRRRTWRTALSGLD